ncbi:hypothetical protein [Geminocystis sp. NIES-3709]|uniref:hypothetical protein n=1 Tax=Geminocystis sp. NIES-3709 TaxID=1617448 RepID=UPI0005FCBCD7|nr:hypothetical protein [Geminocystis sp. NIES-3709]BAQ65233.1 serine/threonine protein kinase [Geminocystis sp. NIES-3709]
MKKLSIITNVLTIFTIISYGFFEKVNIVTSVSAIEPLTQEQGLTDRSKLSINGIGKIRVGMTVAEANKTANTKLVQTKSGGEPYCLYFQPQNAPKNVSFMVIEGRIARIDVNNSQISTISGVRIGDRGSKIKSLYPQQIQVTPHHYVAKGGYYYTFIPKDKADQNYRVVFEVINDRVTTMRSGKLPEVEFIEHCL